MGKYNAKEIVIAIDVDEVNSKRDVIEFIKKIIRNANESMPSLGYHGRISFGYNSNKIEDYGFRGKVNDAEEWFIQTDFDKMEEISSIYREDFQDGEEGDQDFVDVVDDWWGNLDDEEKISVYDEYA